VKTELIEIEDQEELLELRRRHIQDNINLIDVGYAFNLKDREVVIDKSIVALVKAKDERPYRELLNDLVFEASKKYEWFNYD